MRSLSACGRVHGRVVRHGVTLELVYEALWRITLANIISEANFYFGSRIARELTVAALRLRSQKM